MRLIMFIIQISSLSTIRWDPALPFAQVYSPVEKIKEAYDCSERRPSWVIAKSHKPRSFLDKTDTDFPFVYNVNMDGWMTSDIFRHAPFAFDEYISIFDNRRLALLLDKALCHDFSKMELQLRYIEVFQLPPNTTSLSEPMDDGIIASLKCMFRRMQLSRALHIMDTKCNRAYKVDFYKVFIWDIVIWNKFQHS